MWQKVSGPVFLIGKNQQMQDGDMESLKYDSATYADLVASQLQEERYATWVYEAHFFCPPFSF